ncbi:MAG: hypothetical protein RJA31_126 [Actinomycetota bacterium]
MSDHPITPQSASGDSSNPEFAIQPQTRRERRLLEEAARLESHVPEPVAPDEAVAVVDAPANAPEADAPQPVSAATLFRDLENRTMPIEPIAATAPQPEEPVAADAVVQASTTATGEIPTNSSGPIPFIDTTPSGSTAAITAPDVATLTPIEPVAKPRRGVRNRGRNSVVRKVRLKTEREHKKSRGFVPRAGQALRRAARETWSASIRGFVVLVIGAFMVTLTLPSTGFNLAMPGYAVTETGEHQEVTTAANSEVATTVALGEFKISNYGDLLSKLYGSGSWGYSINNNSAIRWPFPYVAPISSGFGARVAPCAACSTYHKGLDFDPPEGSSIYAIADGVVSEVHNDEWGFGRWVVIHHEVKGMSFDSVYAHMERKSVDLKVGDVVKVADYVGRVGSTGTSTGAHLHLEIHVNGAQVDPYQWLKKNVK